MMEVWRGRVGCGLRLAKGELDGFDVVLAELAANSGEKHGFHLLEMETHGGLGDPQDEVAVFDRDGLGMAGNEISGKLCPSLADLIFLESVLSSGGAEN